MSEPRLDKLEAPAKRHTSHSPASVLTRSDDSFPTTPYDEPSLFCTTTLDDAQQNEDSFNIYECGGESGGEEGGSLNGGGGRGGELPSQMVMGVGQLVLDPRIPAAKVEAYKRKLVAHVKRTRDKMRREKEARDENIASFLQKPHHQNPESKETFERRNQRFTEHIAAYAKKLVKYESDYKRLAYLSERKRVVAKPAPGNVSRQGDDEGDNLPRDEKEEPVVDEELIQPTAGKKDITNLFKKFSSHDQLRHKESAVTLSSNDEITAETKSIKSVPRIKHVTPESSDKPPFDDHKLPNTFHDNASSSASLASSNSNYNKRAPSKSKENASVKNSSQPPENLNTADLKITSSGVVNVDSNQTIVPDQVKSSSARDVQLSSLKILDHSNDDAGPVISKENSREKTSSSDRESDFKSQNENAHQSSPSNSAHDNFTRFPVKASSLKNENLSQSVLKAEFEKIIQLQNQDRRNLESLRIKNQQDFASFTEAISEARFRSEHLDEQVSDVIELQQSETENLRLEMKALEEKMSYQVDDRTQDILEMMENIQTRISKLELAQQRQQIVSLEGIEMSAARNLLLKSINILLAFLQLILLITSTFAQLLSPFIKTRSRTLITLVLSIVIAIILKSHPNFQKQLSAFVVKIFHSTISTSHK